MYRNFIILLPFILGIVFCRPDEKYSSQYENVDVDAILQNNRLFDAYFSCVMTGKRCTPDGLELKNNMPDVIATGCSKCNQKQKLMSDKIMHHLINNKQEMYKKLEAKFDPSGSYLKRYKMETKS